MQKALSVDLLSNVTTSDISISGMLRRCWHACLGALRRVGELIGGRTENNRLVTPDAASKIHSLISLRDSQKYIESGEDHKYWL